MNFQWISINLHQISSNNHTPKQLAKSLNSKAFRAVGNAMAKNTNPITVPCHRIIKSDGSLGGYALGVSKKIQLLKDMGLFSDIKKIINGTSYKPIEITADILKKNWSPALTISKVLLSICSLLNDGPR